MTCGFALGFAFAPAAVAGQASLQLEPRSVIDLPAWAWGSESAATLVGNWVLIPLGAGGVAIYDISNPRDPEELALLDTETLGGQGGSASALLGDRLFVVALEKEPTIAVLDLTGPMPPPVLGAFGGIPAPLTVAVAGSELLVQADSSTAYPGGVYAFGTGTQIPTPAGGYLVQLVDPGFLALDDGTVFLARTPAGELDPAGVDVVDFADPETPTFLGHWTSPLPGNVTGIDVEGTRMFLSAYWGGLWVVDVSDFSAMTLWTNFDWLEPEPYAMDVELVDPYVLLLQGGPNADQKRLNFFLLEADGDLHLVGHLPVAGFPSALHRSGRLVVIEELVDVDGDNYYDRKKLRLFEAWLPVFVDGFESGDTSAWD